jgi:hypothetical protein
MYANLEDLRVARNAALAETDWIMLPDSPADERCQITFALYRTLLRELPEDESALEDGLPEKPLVHYSQLRRYHLG